MKKVKNYFLTSLALGSLVAISSPTMLAATPIDYETEGVVSFEEPTDPLKPLNPIDPDPTKPIIPIDPIQPNRPVKPGTQGPLSIDYASNLKFSTGIADSSQAQILTSSAQKITGKGEQLFPNYVQISDRRKMSDDGSPIGWKLQVKQQAQGFTATVGGSQKELLGASIQFSNANVIPATGNTSAAPTTIKDTFSLDPKSAAVNVIDTSQGKAWGTWLYRFGTDENNAVDSIQLNVPAHTEIIPGVVYKTTIVWTVLSAPGV